MRQNASKRLQKALPGGLAILHFKTMGIEPSWVLILIVLPHLDPSKSSIFIGRVVIFKVFRFFLSNNDFNSSWDHLGTISGPFGNILGTISGPFRPLLRPLGASWGLFMAHHHPPWSLSGPKSASIGPKRQPNAQNDLQNVPQRHPK